MLRAILIIIKKNFEDEELSHESFLTTRQATKTRNAFANIVNRYQTQSSSKI